MKLSIVIEDGQLDATGKEGRALMAELRTEEKGYERILTAAWLDKRCVLGKEVEKMIEEMKKLRGEEIKKGVAEQATAEIIN